MPIGSVVIGKFRKKTTTKLTSMKRMIFFYLLSILTLGLNAQNVNFKHDWGIKYLDHDIQLTSKKKAPVPFSTKGEPQAIMFIGASNLDKSATNNLSQIVSDEIAGIRQDLVIDEYLENDYKAKNNIVLYFDKIDNVQIAVIKYRTIGEKGKPRSQPRSTRQILFIHNDKLYISSLIVLYGEDQNNMRSDQMTFIKSILKTK
jgi:hypothetical protein